MKKLTIIAVMLIGIISSSFGQLQQGQGINTWFHKVPMVNNMAFASMTSVSTVSFLAGSRMDAYNNHPTQGTLLANGFLNNNNIGIGCKIDFDKAGLSSHTDAQLAFIYYVPIFSSKGKEDKLSFFLGGHFVQNKFSASDAIVIDPNDKGLENISQFQPNGNASAGFAFLREDKYYVGLSSYQLLETKNSFFNSPLNNRAQRTYYFIGSYTLRLSDKSAFEFSAAGVFASEKAYAWEAGVDFKFNKVLWVGGGYKSAGALKFDFGVTTNSWSFGYLCSCGSWVDATSYTYKAMHNSILIRKYFDEGRKSK